MRCAFFSVVVLVALEGKSPGCVWKRGPAFLFGACGDVGGALACGERARAELVEEVGAGAVVLAAGVAALADSY